MTGWAKFKEGTKVFKGAGLQYKKSKEFFNDIQKMVEIPKDYSADFNDVDQVLRQRDVVRAQHRVQPGQGRQRQDLHDVRA